MNILDIQDKLKNLSQDQLSQEMQMPSGSVPQFLVLGELNRRQSMRQSMQQQGAGAQTVAQDLLNGAGVPSEGMSEMGRSMAPKSSIAQNTGISALPQEAPPPEQGGIAALAPTGMYAGGPVTKMAGGSQGAVSPLFSFLSGDIFGRDIEPYDPARKESEYGSHNVVDGYQLNMAQDQEARARALDQPVPQRSGPTPLSVFNQQEEQRKAAAAAAKPPSGAATNGASGSGSGSGPMSTYEKMLQDAMANAEKKAKQDKWLALAQAGMALMSSDAGNLAGAIGEAGKVGIEALQSARDTGTATQLQLAKEQFGIDQDREARARSAASAGRPKPRTASGILSEISSINEILSGMTQTDEMGMPIPPDDATLATMAQLKAQADALIAEYGQLQGTGVDLSDVPQ